MFVDSKIGFVGMSHLGLNYAVATAKKNFKVICYDENVSIVNILNKKKNLCIRKRFRKKYKI